MFSSQNDQNLVVNGIVCFIVMIFQLQYVAKLVYNLNAEFVYCLENSQFYGH